MTKASKSPTEKQAVRAAPNTAKIVRNPETGEIMTVKGYGALKDFGFEIREDIDLVKPIYEQVIGKRSRKRKAG